MCSAQHGTNGKLHLLKLNWVNVNLPNLTSAVWTVCVSLRTTCGTAQRVNSHGWFLGSLPYHTTAIPAARHPAQMHPVGCCPGCGTIRHSRSNRKWYLTSSKRLFISPTSLWFSCSNWKKEITHMSSHTWSWWTLFSTHPRSTNLHLSLQPIYNTSQLERCSGITDSGLNKPYESACL